MTGPNQTALTSETEYCPKHPTVEARLRCNRCGRLMCTKCAVRTPTGYRCDDCVKGQQKVFITAKTQDYILGPLVAGVLSAIAGIVLTSLWIYFIIFGSPFVGGLIAEAARRVIGRRRATNLFKAIAAAVFLGGLAPSLLMGGLLLIGLTVQRGLAGGDLAAVLSGFGLDFIWQLVYAVLASGAAYYRLSGLRL